MNQLKLPFALIFTKIYFTIFNVFHLHVCIEGRPKRLKMDKILKWIIHNFYFLLLKHKSYILKWRYETKYLIFVFKIQYLYIKLRLFCIQPEWNGLNMIPMLLVLHNESSKLVLALCMGKPPQWELLLPRACGHLRC